MTGFEPTAMLAMGGPQGGGGQASMIPMLGYMVIFFGLFYFLMIRPQVRREKERKKMIDEMKTGDRILFCGGMLGVVSNVKEQTVVIKIADNVKVEAARGSVLRVLAEDEKIDMDVTKQG